MAVETILKAPGETLEQVVRFAAIASAVTVLAVDVQVQGRGDGPPALGVAHAIVAGQVVLTISGGADGEQYAVRVDAVDGAAREDSAELLAAVLDPAWTMPDGSAPYLSIAEFVDRAGLKEVVTLTDAAGDGTIDRALLINKLIDAQAVVDSHLAGRYMVPLADVPLIVKKYVADLTLAALYPGGAPDGVSDAAKQTLRALERLQAGLATIPAATPPAPAVTEQPVLISPGVRAYPDGLAGFAHPFDPARRW